MKTERLIDMLSMNLEPVKRPKVGATLALAIVVGGAAAFCIMLTTVGLRSENDGAFRLGFLALKLAFMLSVIGLGAALLDRLIRPGQEARRLAVFVFLPFLVVGLAGLVVLTFVRRPATWGPMIMGAQWASCLVCIPLFAIVPFAILIWVLRQGAPTSLKRTGAIAGLVAGALGAVAYAFHCPDDSVPFIAIWYSAMVGLCALIGAIVGPRFLRW